MEFLDGRGTTVPQQIHNVGLTRTEDGELGAT
jgi:hypothetical protein